MKSFLKVFYLLIVAVIVFTGALMVAQGMRDQREKEAEEAAAQAARLEAESRRQNPFDAFNPFFGSGWDFLFDSMYDDIMPGGEESAL